MSKQVNINIDLDECITALMLRLVFLGFITCEIKTTESNNDARIEQLKLEQLKAK